MSIDLLTRKMQNIILSISTLLGSLQNSSMLSGRIVIIFTLILSMLIYQFYSASIVSFLLMKPTATIKSLKDILHSGMKVGCEDILYIRDFLMVYNKLKRCLEFKLM